MKYQQIFFDFDLKMSQHGRIRFTTSRKKFQCKVESKTLSEPTAKVFLAPTPEIKAPSSDALLIKNSVELPRPQEWGPLMWTMIDNAVLKLRWLEEENPPAEILLKQKSDLYKFFEGLPAALPCWTCTKNTYAHYSERTPDVSSSKALEAWVGWLKTRVRKDKEIASKNFSNITQGISSQDISSTIPLTNKSLQRIQPAPETYLSKIEKSELKVQAGLNSSPVLTEAEIRQAQFYSDMRNWKTKSCTRC